MVSFGHKVRKAGGVVWDGLEADGKRLKLIRRVSLC